MIDLRMSQEMKGVPAETKCLQHYVLQPQARKTPKIFNTIFKNSFTSTEIFDAGSGIDNTFREEIESSIVKSAERNANGRSSSLPSLESTRTVNVLSSNSILNWPRSSAVLCHIQPSSDCGRCPLQPVD